MRLALCAAQIPFLRGGAEYLCDNLYRELVQRGHEVEYVRLPFQWDPPQEIINSCLAWRLLDLTQSAGKKIDGVIATKFPSYAVKHENKVAWIIHQHRAAYDLAGTGYDHLGSHGRTGQIVRRKIHTMDGRFLREAKGIYTISQNVSSRLWRYNQLKGEALYPPPPLAGRYLSGDYGDYAFYPSRLDPLKRQDLIIESMKYVKNDLRLKIAGSGTHLSQCMKLARDLGVKDKVDFLGQVSDEELINLYANALCVPYVPVDEDLGFVTMESFFSSKPVITGSDSGGSLEFVKDGVNGFVVSPRPEEIASKMDALFEGGLAQKMGEKGFSEISDMKISWDHVVSELLRPIG